MTRRWPRVLGFAGAWIAVLAIYVLLIMGRSEVPFVGALLGSLGSIVPASLFGVIVWRVAARLAWPRRTIPVLVASHALLSLVYAALLLGAIVWELRATAPPVALSSFLRYSAGWQFLMGVLVYGAIAAIAHSVRVGRALQEREAAAARSDALRVRAELQALRAQLDPHFLFNTLHSIMALVRAGDPSRLEGALERYAGMMRYVLDVNRDGRDDVALQDELGFVHDYLALESLRLGDRLRVVEEVDADALECVIPCFTLQPLVENAIRHGLAPRAYGGTLRIAARLIDDTLALEVGDDGDGAVAARADVAPGLGLRVARQRLATRYGERASLTVVTAPGNGFIVRVALPAEVTRSASHRIAPSGAVTRA